jgi:flagellar FliL protein
MAEEATAAVAEAGEAKAEAEAPAKKGGSKLFVIIGAVVAVLGLGGGAAWYFKLIPHGAKTATDEEGGEGGKEAKPAVGAMVGIDPFIANLSDADGKRYLKATLQVEFFDAKEPEEFHKRQSQLRDVLLTLFTSKTFDEIRTPQGKALLRDEVITRINRVLNKDVVKAVYFTEFIIQ